MLKLPGYNTIKKLYEGRNSIVYRGVKSDNNQKVIIKVPIIKLPNMKSANKLLQEYEIQKSIHSKYVVNYVAILPDPIYGYVLIEEDEQGVPLSNCIPPQGFETLAFLKAAIQLAKGLVDIHGHHIIHKDIKPANLIMIEKYDKIKYIDFGNAMPLHQSQINLIVPYMSSGTLNYISPEQTGRMNRAVDYRTDFYSLGVTLYQLACGQLPFKTKTALELLYCHIAKPPIAPSTVNPRLPLPISNIIMKLMMKDAEARYQSAKGLLLDLMRCQVEFSEKNEIEPFVLGESDFPIGFHMPQKLYSRNDEAQCFIGKFEQLLQGKPEVCMVTGSAGVGKTFFVKEMRKFSPFTQEHFLAGKFEQLNRNVAYSAIAQAFQDWIKQLLVYEESELAAWKAKLLNVLGNNGQLIIDIIPELELIIGPQSVLPELETVNAKSRFHWVFQAMISAIAEPTCPLILFLDDLQWADLASLNLLEAIFSSPDIKYFLLIGAYRDSEVKDAHPTLLTLKTISQAHINVKTIHLNSLTREDIHEWMIDIFQDTSAHIKEFSDLIFLKTQGNPFFVKSFLQVLYDEKIIKQVKDKGWLWNLIDIRQHPAAENVIELMLSQLKQLPTETQMVLAAASCIGYYFSLDILEKVTLYENNELLKYLQPVLESNMVVKVDERFRFNHDQVQKAAYKLIREMEQARIHLLIGRLLKADISENSNQPQFFEVVDHLNQGQALIIKDEEKIDLAKMNLLAGKKAKSAIAYAASLDYLYQAECCFIKNDVWSVDYATAVDLYKELMECEYLNNNFDATEKLFTYLLKNLRSNTEKSEIYILSIVLKTLRAHYQEAIDLGLESLGLLDINIDINNLPALISEKSALLKIKLSEQTPDSLLNEEDMKNAQKKIAMKLLYSLSAPAFIANQMLYAVSSMTMVDLTLDYGKIEESAMGYSVYAILLMINFGDPKFGYDLSLLAMRMSEKFNDFPNQCRTKFIHACFIHHWIKPFQETDEIVRQAYQNGWESGEIQFLGYLAQYQATHFFYQGLPLSTVSAELNKLAQLPHNRNNQIVVDMINAVKLVTLNLLGQTQGFTDENLQSDLIYQECWIINNNHYVLCNYLILKAQVLYLHNNLEEAFNCIELATQHLPAISSHFSLSVHNYFHSLILLRLYPDAHEEQQEVYWQQLIMNQNRMESWSTYCPDNFRYKYCLIAAEMEGLKNNISIAMDLYSEAISLVELTDVTQEIALASELAGNFLLKRGNKPFARGLLRAAYTYYLKWGASRKVESMRELQWELLDLSSLNPNTSFSMSGENFIDSYSLHSLNLSSILKASQAISGEIELSQLLFDIIKVVIESAGAQRGTFFLAEANHLFVQAEYNVSGEITTLQAIPLMAWKNGAQSIVTYVKRTLAPVLLGYASKEQQFKQDSYVLTNQIKSVLCLPLLKTKELKGIIYIENNLTPHAFSEQQLNILRLLASQMAISLENSLMIKKEIEASRKIAEEQRLRAEEAEEHKIKMKKFVDMVCHEMRNPMTGILGSNEILAEYIVVLKKMVNQNDFSGLNKVIEQLEESSEITKQCVNHQRLVVESVLELSKISAGKTSLSMQKFQLKLFFQEIVKLFTMQVESKKIKLILSLPELDYLINTDFTLLKIIVANLVSNAVKFTNEGYVKITSQVFLVSPTEGNLIITVEDTGVGITKEEQAHLFERFVRASSSQYEGYGLGLTITKHFLDLMHGHIEVESEKDEGTTMRINLRCEMEAVKEEKKPPIEQQKIALPVSPLTPKKLLIVEDNVVNQKILKRHLDGLKYHCTIANDGQEALLMFKNDTFDFIFMDIEMPLMDGLEATKQIRAIEQQELNKVRTPIVGLSAYSSDEYAKKALDAGMDGYITKPVKQSDLKEQIAKWTCVNIIDTDKKNNELERKNLEAKMPPHSPSLFRAPQSSAYSVPDPNRATEKNTL